MLDLVRRHQALAEDYCWHLQMAADKLLALPSWSLEATVVDNHNHTLTQGQDWFHRRT
jgi:hypothetical protein